MHQPLSQQNEPPGSRFHQPPLNEGLSGGEHSEGPTVAIRRVPSFFSLVSGDSFASFSLPGGGNDRESTVRSGALHVVPDNIDNSVIMKSASINMSMRDRRNYNKFLAQYQASETKGATLFGSK